MTDFGPPYVKINSAFKRDMSIAGNPVIPFDWAAPEFEYLSTMPWNWTEKIDGTNIRLFWDGATVTLGGRTDNAQIPARLVEAITNLGLLKPDLWAEKWPYRGMGDYGQPEPSVTLYGEGYGEGIQKGGGNYGETSFILFDVRVHSVVKDHNWWLDRRALEEIAADFNIDLVPQYGNGPYSPTIVWSCLKDNVLRSHWDGVQIEGLVGTPAVPLFNRKGERIIMKMKVRDWTEYAKTHLVR